MKGQTSYQEGFEDGVERATRETAERIAATIAEHVAHRVGDGTDQWQAGYRTARREFMAIARGEGDASLNEDPPRCGECGQPLGADETRPACNHHDHRCGYDYDPRCDGCRAAYRDAGRSL